MGDSSDPSDLDEPSSELRRLLRARLAGESDEEPSDDQSPHAPAHPPSPDPPATDGERSALPSALDVLDPSVAKPDFLHVAGPEFDSSKDFKPPPVTAAELGPVSEFHTRKAPAMGEQQRVDPEFDWGRPEGAIRLRGSVCFETDDERGRRVRYGAHAMLKADPWSACNPNFSMSDSSVTRGKDRGGAGKRKFVGDV